MKLSVVIVNYNVQHFLEQCLHAALKAAEKVETEIFVVDNNSADGSCLMVRQKFPQVILLENKENTGFSRANNQAMQIAKGEYILLLNPDTVVSEDTFLKCINFMDVNQDAGGLGVYMIDGKGNFLPESKRGLPTPSVAFYKIFGLAALFPKSKTFGSYHLGYLDKNKPHSVDVLSGAFMMLRKNVLDKIGLLDETFFMYGEDIDLSYRITQAGYKNFYFPETHIIHYKGESTKKSSVNYVFVFYKAMLIFARKHFSKQNAWLYSSLINIAVYLRAALAIGSRIVSQLAVPLLDAVFIYGGVKAIQFYWETNIKAFHYPPFFDFVIVPGYIAFWIFSVWISGGYNSPIRISKVLRGILSGSVFILVVYSLLPETMRFSRAMILLGTGWACLITSTFRFVLNAAGFKLISLDNDEKKRVIIIGNELESKRVFSLLQNTEVNLNFIGYVRKADKEYSALLKEPVLGNLAHLNQIVEIYKVNEIIFCADDISSAEIINQMLLLNKKQLEFKIAPSKSPVIIGSSSINEQGEIYYVDLNSINNAVNRRNKRLLDLAVSFLLVCFFPVTIFMIKQFDSFINNALKVIAGKKTWVGFTKSQSTEVAKFKQGIITPIDGLNIAELDSSTIDRLNMLYAKDYSIYSDLEIIFRNLKNLGKKVA